MVMNENGFASPRNNVVTHLFGLCGQLQDFITGDAELRPWDVKLRGAPSNSYENVLGSVAHSVDL